MKLAALLYVLKLKLRCAAWKDGGFRKLLKKRDYTLVIRTADSTVGRSFTFSGGRVLSKRGTYPAPDMEMVWCDADTAFRAMVAGDDTAVIQALGKSQLKIEGNLDHFFWFGDVLKRMMGKES